MFVFRFLADKTRFDRECSDACIYLWCARDLPPTSPLAHNNITTNRLFSRTVNGSPCYRDITLLGPWRKYVSVRVASAAVCCKTERGNRLPCVDQRFSSTPTVSGVGDKLAVGKISPAPWLRFRLKRGFSSIHVRSSRFRPSPRNFVFIFFSTKEFVINNVLSTRKRTAVPKYRFQYTPTVMQEVNGGDPCEYTAFAPVRVLYTLLLYPRIR